MITGSAVVGGSANLGVLMTFSEDGTLAYLWEKKGSWFDSDDVRGDRVEEQAEVGWKYIYVYMGKQDVIRIEVKKRSR